MYKNNLEEINGKIFTKLVEETDKNNKLQILYDDLHDQYEKFSLKKEEMDVINNFDYKNVQTSDDLLVENYKEWLYNNGSVDQSISDVNSELWKDIKDTSSFKSLVGKINNWGEDVESFKENDNRSINSIYNSEYDFLNKVRNGLTETNDYLNINLHLEENWGKDLIEIIKNII